MPIDDKAMPFLRSPAGSRQHVLITGSNGGIGSAMVASCHARDIAVIGIDKSPDINTCDIFIQEDIQEVIDNQDRLQTFTVNLRSIFEKKHTVGVINNAAFQVVSPFSELSEKELSRSLAVNTIFPFQLCKIAAPYLSQNNGVVINVGSVHSKLTKTGFLAYSTSKAALSGLTRSLAIELAPYIRVNEIVPAAIATPMLEEGFLREPEKRESLARFHPMGQIGTPADVAELAILLLTSQIPFMTGAQIDLSGGIHSVLHDPG